MNVDNTNLKGVLSITPSTIYEDFRGEYIETYNKNNFLQKNINIDFIQDDISISRKNVLRGIHGDNKTWKLISCLYGSFYLVVVNNDPSSNEFKKFQSFTLSDQNKIQILVPPKFGNGHLVLSKKAIFHYKQSTDYDRSSQFTIKWNNPDYDIWWPINNPIISIRDQ